MISRHFPSGSQLYVTGDDLQLLSELVSFLFDWCLNSVSLLALSITRENSKIDAAVQVQAYLHDWDQVHLFFSFSLSVNI